MKLNKYSMKNKLIMLLIVTLSITSSFGQSKQDSIIVYKQVKDWAIVRLTIAYMEDFRPEFSKYVNEKDVPSEQNDEYKTYKKLSEKYSEFSESINLESFAKNLKDGDWEKANDIVFKEYKSDLNKIDNFKNISYTPKKVKDDARNKALQAIKEVYHQNLKVNKSASTSSTVKVGNEKTNTEFGDKNRTEYYGRKDSSNINYLLYLLISILCMLAVWIKRLKFRINKLNLKLTNSKNKDQKEKRKEKKRFEEKYYNAISGSKLDATKPGDPKIKKLNDTISGNSRKESVDQNVKFDKPNYPVTETRIDDTIQPSTNFDPSPISQVESSKTIYLPQPTAEKTFLNKHAKDNKDSRSFYVVTISGNIGSLTILEDVDFTRALSSPERFFEKACDYDNEYSQNAKAVKVEQTGEIKLEGNDWVVTKKVRIKFI